MVYIIIEGQRTPVYGMWGIDDWVESVYLVYSSREAAEKYLPDNNENSMFHIEEHKIINKPEEE